LLRGHKEEKDDRAWKGGMGRLKRRRCIKSLESATGHHMGGRMDQLLDACEGDQKCAHKHLKWAWWFWWIGYWNPITIDLLALNLLGCEP
jgi:hypothetical protein